MVVETEVKFRIDDKERIVLSLREEGFEKEDRYRERNILFDRDGELESTDRLLRIRRIEGTSTKEILTYKGPKSGDGKSREEIELEVDIRKIASIFEKLGFVPTYKYEKIREVWLRDDQEIVIDELPYLGLYMEIEANIDEIESLASELGFDMSDSITDTYVEIFDRYRQKNNIKQKFLIWETYGVDDL